MSTQPATDRQLDYITGLRQDKAWRMEKDFHLMTEMGAAFVATETAGRAAYAADVTDLTSAEASALIDTLKNW